MVKNNRAQYYEVTGFSELLKNKKGKKVGLTAKRITMNISDRIYDEANELDSYMKMGYQNVLKTAMTIGLTKLYDHVSLHKIRDKKAVRMPSWPAHKRKLVDKQHAAHASNNASL
jgi:hypothetical protein